MTIDRNSPSPVSSGQNVRPPTKPAVPRVVGVAVLAVAGLLASLLSAVPGNAGTAAPAGPSGASDEVRLGMALASDAVAPPDRPTDPASPGGGPDPTHPRSLVNDPTDDATAQDTQSTTTITVAGPNLIAAFNDSGSFLDGAPQLTGYSVSTDRGKTWVDQGELPESESGDGGFPVLATDTSSGRVYLASTGLLPPRAVLVFRSDDDGMTFGAPVIGTPGFIPVLSAEEDDFTPDPRLFFGSPGIAVDNFPGPGRGNVYLGWTQFGGPFEGLKLSRSTNGGTTWGPDLGETILPYDGSGASVVVSPDHCVHFFFLSNLLGGNTMKVRTSCDQGVTFGPAVLITDLRSTGVIGDLGLNGGLRSRGFPHTAVNPVTGTLYVTYNDLTASEGADIFLKSSDDGGATWSAPVRVNSDRTANDQFNPAIAVGLDGLELMVGWYDRRADPENLDIERFSRTATIHPASGDLTFEPEFRLSPSFPVVVAQDPVLLPDFMGDYDQIVAGRRHFYTTWGDNRDGNLFHENQPDVRFARVRLS